MHSYPFHCDKSDIVTELMHTNGQFISQTNINPRPDGGAKGPPVGFSPITQIRLEIALRNFQYLSGHQFYASSEKNLPEVTQGQKL